MAIVRCAVALASPYQLANIKAALEGAGIDVLFAVQDGQGAVDACMSATLDALVLDMTLPIYDALGVVGQIKRRGAEVVPAVIVLRAAPMPMIEHELIKSGVMAIIDKSDGIDALISALRPIGVHDRLVPDGSDIDAITLELIALGFKRKHLGTNYLARAIQLAATDLRLTERLTTELYPMIADEFGTLPGRVDHGIRRAIEAAWSSGEITTQHRIFGNTIDARRGKPVNGDMIARMAQLIRAKEIDA